ncbi:N-acetylmuramoyl-L-alanine amidase [Gallaecimonas sp. GXIMD1310]|uniref:N-acetylmuramoyl-L-alanine amidase n=1 Tax=Gallaecimonas sp. GXIMD1310 TaxID=3131926 RepID=UPI003253A2B1
MKAVIPFLLLLLLSSCSQLPLKSLPSPNYNDRVKFLVLHFTAEDFAGSVRALVSEHQVSSHYLIPQHHDPSYPYSRLAVFQLVPEDKRAWHAGVSYWQGREDLNDTSIGVEIVNQPDCQPPPYPDGRRQCQYPAFDPEQISLVVRLAQQILARHPDIGPTQVIGHADIAPDRKDDPGPRFPWQQLYQAGVGAWYEQDTRARYRQAFGQRPLPLPILQQALADYGYRLQVTGSADRQTRDVLLAFQMHFLPQAVSGKPDLDTAATIFALLSKYFPEKAATLWAAYQQAEIIPAPPEN